MTTTVLPLPETCGFCPSPATWLIEDDGVPLAFCSSHIVDAFEWDHAWDGVA